MKYLIDTNILLEILPINYRARVHKKKQQLMTPSLRSDKGTSLEFAACEALAFFALTPSPSPTLWERGVADKGTSLGFTVCKVRPLSALTPSPSPTAWERGAAR